ncbi:MAG: 3-deoxy-D-manno-octulosonic acid transferase [Pyrinomonadaceae bacterium]
MNFELSVYLLYSFALTIGFLLLLPRFLWDAARKGKYAAGFLQRLGYLPDFDRQNKKIIWLHCVSVGEVNAAKPLAKALLENFPDYRLVVSTTTKTGQALAQTIFHNQAALVFYFPFDWQFTVRRVLQEIKPDVMLIMETELWFNFLREAKRQNIKIALVNGRLSEKSFKNYSLIRGLMRKVLSNLDLALMSDAADARRIVDLGCDSQRVFVMGNIKYDLAINENENDLTRELRARFDFEPGRPLIVAASTHEPEEKWILAAFKKLHKQIDSARLMIVPRHPERFERIAELIKESGFTLARRSSELDKTDIQADVVLLDSVGELRAAYPLAALVFVGGSLIPHGGQNILEPAAARRAIVTGFYTMNFAAVVKTFLAREAIIQLSELKETEIPIALAENFRALLSNDTKCATLADNAFAVLQENSGATVKTIDKLQTELMSNSNF